MSFSVNFTLDHQDAPAFLPDADQAGMGQEYDRDKPPYEVVLSVVIQGWYLLQADGDRPAMGLYVRFVAPQIELLARLDAVRWVNAAGEFVQSCRQAGHAVQFGREYVGGR